MDAVEVKGKLVHGLPDLFAVFAKGSLYSVAEHLIELPADPLDGIVLLDITPRVSPEIKAEIRIRK